VWVLAPVREEAPRHHQLRTCHHHHHPLLPERLALLLLLVVVGALLQLRALHRHWHQPACIWEGSNNLHNRQTQS
jgi:hypothetical protein